MNRFIRGVQIITVFIISIGFFWTIKQFDPSFFIANQYDIAFQGSFSWNQKNKIKNFLCNNELKTLALREVSKKIKISFPSIKSINFKQSADHVISVFILSETPKLKINSNLVLSDNGFVFRKNIFSDDFVANLNRVDFLDIEFVIEDKNEDFFYGEKVGILPQDFIDTIDQIPSDLFSLYRILCQDKSKWWLQDREQEKFLVLFYGEKIPKKIIVDACNKLKKTLYEQGCFSVKKSRKWVADVRFKDQIVLFAKSGGR